MVISVARAASTQPAQVPPGNGKPTPVSKSWYVDDSALMQAGKKALEALNRMVNEASFCVAQWRRTEFLCSEKEGTARGTRGRLFRCVGLTVTSQKATTKRTHHTHKGKDARRSLDSGLPHSLRQSDRGRQRRERATRAVSKNKLPPTTPRLFFCMGPGATESLFLQARGGPSVVTSWRLMTSRLATGG